ncbi:DUF1365 domain-containing protein [Thioclava sp. GXIMD4216]|uniref:DUF1365 domain-containing protein n=1 Tax=Thioclava litoralis TaxID=3076557 RepID=A0ABZ1E160_9RHOB|nr:DUF1365 domain-containing protein [Thioclava sp. FTW29]
MIDYLPGETVHVRRGAIDHRFRYPVDYLCLDPEHPTGPSFFSHNRLNLFAFFDRDHGGIRGAGEGAAWARRMLTRAGLTGGYSLRLMAQPRVLGRAFNPVCFWMAFREETLLAVIAEVNNTFGDRHNYLCAHDDFSPILPDHVLEARKIFHVSPFQDIGGGYHFQYAITAKHAVIRIDFRNGGEGLIATYRAPRMALTNRRILQAVLRRPWAPVRIMALIYWQALRLKLKGARYRDRPAPPKEDLSR